MAAITELYGHCIIHYRLSENQVYYRHIASFSSLRLVLRGLCILSYTEAV